MSTIQSPKSRRLPVSLTAQDEADLDLIRNSPVARAAVGAPEGASDAALIGALMRHAAAQAVDAAQEAGYAALAESYRTDPEEIAVRAAMRARRRFRPDEGD